ncbi:YpsA SLOG family protein, partial [Solemya velum gill symbiont]|uniref:YpsA SLOG family protein n=1 Tax=Solemya velum gill symbiont TaxID=2340 RepID=UPI00351CCAA3
MAVFLNVIVVSIFNVKCKQIINYFQTIIKLYTKNLTLITVTRYSLLETVSENYSVRTRLNVEDSDATLIISAEPLSGGTHLTAAYASQVHKPLYILNGCKVNTTIFVELRCWLTTYKVRTLNIAG